MSFRGRGGGGFRGGRGGGGRGGGRGGGGGFRVSIFVFQNITAKINQKRKLLVL